MNKEEKLYNKILDAIVVYEHPTGICWFYTDNIKQDEFSNCYSQHKRFAKTILESLLNEEELEEYP